MPKMNEAVTNGSDASAAAIRTRDDEGVVLIRKSEAKRLLVMYRPTTIVP